MTLKEHICGKFYAVQVLVSFMLRFANWEEVWNAHCEGIQFPPVRLRNGPFLSHFSEGECLSLIREVFEARVYTGSHFYIPAKGDVILDIGANAGFFAAFLATYHTPITIHCFEPGSQALAKIHENISLNQLERFVVVHPVAVSDRNGIARLSRNGATVFGRLLTSEVCGDSEQVKTITFAEAVNIVGAKRIAMLKMDVEGTELQIIENSLGESWEGIDKVAVEYHEFIYPGCRRTIERKLREFGFKDFHYVSENSPPGTGVIRASR